MGLIDTIGDGPVAVDTVVFIYFLEEHPRFFPVVLPLFEAIDAGRVGAVTSGITLLETLVIPYRAGNAALVGQYEALLTNSRHLELVALDQPLLRAAAALRATHPIKTPDACRLPPRSPAVAPRSSPTTANSRPLRGCESSTSVSSWRAGEST